MNERYPENERLAIMEMLRSTLCEMDEIARRLYDWNWIDTTGGSMSIRLPERPDLFALTPTHSGFRRWKLLEHGLAVLDKDLNLTPYSTATHRAHPSAIVHAHVFKEFEKAKVVLHTHSPYSLAFAVKNMAIKPYTLHSQILGEVPCLTSDADQVKDRHSSTVTKREKRMTSGMQGYDYALNHFEELLEQITAVLKPRANELERHGLAFTVYKHGIFVIARNLSEAFDNLIRVERNAQVQILSSHL